jgi:GT2 family glycosyltransferase
LPKEVSEILVFDNGYPDLSESVVLEFQDRLPVRYTANEVGHGLGFSLTRGALASRGRLILELNDDAMVPADLFGRLRSVFVSDESVGVIGVRAIEGDQVPVGDRIGWIDEKALMVCGNFFAETESIIEVEHVYGFCYAYRGELLDRGGLHDQILLATDFSSGDRIETDHCLTAKRLGYRVVYDGRIAVVHLAKPRSDMNEMSPRWRFNSVRNTLYLYLKHYGWLGRSGLGARFCLFFDVGLFSFLRSPSKRNWDYFFIGLKGRASAVWYWLKYRWSRLFPGNARTR